MSRADSPRADLHRDYLATLIRRYGPTASGLEQLVQRCHGAYPADVRDMADALGRAHPGSVAATSTRQVAADIRPLEAAGSRLPLQHPLDFEWRFAGSGDGCMIERLSAATGVADHVALLGTPGLAEQFAHHTHGSRRATLFERRPEACSALADQSPFEVVDGDVANTWHNHIGRFTFAVADPPWYPSLGELFLRVAAQLLKPGGQLYWCAPGLGTRPGLLDERASLIAMAADAGLVLEQLEASAVPYECPPFEVFALEAAHLPVFDHTWRRGDLLTFRRTQLSVSQHPTPIVAPPRGTDDWREVGVGRGRIRVNLGTTRTSNGSALESVVEGDILDSVSTRDERRRGANVWTSTNRIWRTNGPTQLLESLKRRQESASIEVNNPFDEAAHYIARSELDMLNSIGIE